MIERRVALGARSYTVQLVRGGGPARVAEAVAALAPTRVAVVTDETVAGLHLGPVRAALAGLGLPPAEVVVPAGEGSKSVAVLERVWLALHEAGCDRRACVLALGGGVVGDLAGFAAATWMRGVPVVHAPTTLLAMVDSAVGGKTGIDLRGKNLVGAFHQPSAVVCDLTALATLPARERTAALGEVWKTALLAGEGLVARLEATAPAVAAGDLDALEPVVAACVDLKASIVERDEREQGERAWLNLGHTLGHALEATEPDLRHGEAVAVGVAFACLLARRLGAVDAAWTARALALGRALGLRLAPPRPVDLAALGPWLLRDKKAAAGRVRWVVPEGFGRCALRSDVGEDALRAALDDLGGLD